MMAANTVEYITYHENHCKDLDTPMELRVSCDVLWGVEWGVYSLERVRGAVYGSLSRFDTLCNYYKFNIAI